MIALPFHAQAEGGRLERAKLADLANRFCSKKLKAEDLYAVLKIGEMKLQLPDDASEVPASIEFHEMDFGDEGGKHARMADFGGSLVKKDGRWAFKFADAHFDRPDSAAGEYYPYSRVASQGQTDSCVLVPLDRQVVGFEADGEYEVGFKLTVEVPAYHAKPGEPSENERPGHDETFPSWWETRKGRLPVLGVRYAEDDKPLTMQDFENALNPYIAKLRDWQTTVLQQQETALDYFGVKPDQKPPPKGKGAPIGWFALIKEAYGLAQIAFPAFKSLGVLVELAENMTLPAVGQKPEVKVLGTREQAVTAVKKVHEAGKLAVTFFSHLDAFLCPTSEADVPKDKLELGDFIQRGLVNIGSLRKVHKESTNALEQAIKERREKTADELLKREVIAGLKSQAKELEERAAGVPEISELVGKLAAEYMNQNGFGVFTWTPPLPLPYETTGTRPYPHSHVWAGQEEQQHHLTKVFMNIGLGFDKGGHFYVSGEGRKKFVPELKLFREFNQAGEWRRHFSTVEDPKGPCDGSATHYLHLLALEDNRGQYAYMPWEGDRYGYRLAFPAESEVT